MVLSGEYTYTVHPPRRSMTKSGPNKQQNTHTHIHKTMLGQKDSVIYLHYSIRTRKQSGSIFTTHEPARGKVNVVQM